MNQTFSLVRWSDIKSIMFVASHLLLIFLENSNQIIGVGSKTISKLSNFDYHLTCSTKIIHDAEESLFY